MNSAPRTVVAANFEASRWLRPALFTVAALCAGAGVYRLIKLDGPPDRDVLFFFVAAVVVLLADSVQKFKFGDMEFERVQRLEERVQELAEVSRAPTTAVAAEPPAAVDAAGPPASQETSRSFDSLVVERTERIYAGSLRWGDDPVAVEGAPSAAHGSRLQATVSPSKNYDDRFHVAIDVEVGASVALKQHDRVAFFLHQTFPEKVRLVLLEGRRASLALISAGTFTVGALLPDGTFLSLNLMNARFKDMSETQRRRFEET